MPHVQSCRLTPHSRKRTRLGLTSHRLCWVNPKSWAPLWGPFSPTLIFVISCTNLALIAETQWLNYIFFFLKERREEVIVDRKSRKTQLKFCLAPQQSVIVNEPFASQMEAFKSFHAMHSLMQGDTHLEQHSWKLQYTIQEIAVRCLPGTDRVAFLRYEPLFGGFSFFALIWDASDGGELKLTSQEATLWRSVNNSSAFKIIATLSLRFTVKLYTKQKVNFFLIWPL